MFSSAKRFSKPISHDKPYSGIGGGEGKGALLVVGGVGGFGDIDVAIALLVLFDLLNSVVAVLSLDEEEGLVGPAEAGAEAEETFRTLVESSSA